MVNCKVEWFNVLLALDGISEMAKRSPSHQPTKHVPQTENSYHTTVNFDLTVTAAPQ